MVFMNGHNWPLWRLPRIKPEARLSTSWPNCQIMGELAKLQNCKKMIISVTVCNWLVLIVLQLVNLAAGASQLSDGPATNERPFASMLISGLIEARVSLPCDISPPTSDDSVALILWYKDDSVAPIYTLDARKETQLERARVSIDEAYSTRATFSHSNKPAQLQLEQLKLEDEGDYRCRVDFRRGRTVNTIISLRIIVPPQDVRIVSPSKPTQKLEGHIGPLDEGQELVLLCLAQGGKPRPQLSWRHDYSVIEETYQRLDKDGTSNELRIPALTRSHLLSKFICQANNSQPINTEITLDLNLKPQDILIRQLSGEQEPLVVGQNKTFECLSSGSRPQATIYWLFQGIRHQPPTEFLQQQSLSRLTLTLQQSFNQQPLTCVAENERLNGGGSSGSPLPNSIRQTLKLDVQFAPQLSIRLEGGQWKSADGSTSVGSAGATSEPSGADQPLRWAPQQGNDIYLTCQLEANPRPNKPILWRHNGHLISSSSQQHSTIVMNNQSLVLRKINPSQSGSYTCESSNSLGSNSSLPLELNVRHAPICATDDILTYQVIIGQTIAIDCQVVANPPKSVHFSWFKSTLEGNLTDWLERDASLDDQIDDSSQILKIKVKDRKQLGRFKCKAKNEIGLQQRACLFQLVEAQVPKLRHSCRQAGLAGANSLTIACEPNDHLKSDEFELSGPGGSSMKDHNQQQQHRMSSKLMENYWPLGLTVPSNPGTADELLAPLRARLVHPPRWLLVEVYKVSATNDNELVSYVIVSSASQLATIKSLVETNQVFKANPKGTYYVMTKPPINGSDEVANNSSSKSVSNFEQGHQSSLASKLFQAHQQTHMLDDNLLLVEDPTIQLASSFRFNIPNLEPESRYKFMIFAQNVGSKTRDWIALRADTPGAEPLESRSRTLADSSSSTESGDTSTISHQPQKSLVMRSDYPQTDGTSTSNSNHNNNDNLDFDANLEGASDQSASNNNKTGAGVNFGSRFLEVAARKWPLVQSQVGAYADRALLFARQRPLLALPIAIITSISILFALILLINQLTRRASKSQQQQQTRSKQAPSADQKRPSNDLQDLDEEEYSAGANDSGSNQSTRKSPVDLSPQIRLMNQQQDLSRLNASQLLSSSNSAASSSSSSNQVSKLAPHLHAHQGQGQQKQQVFAICTESPANETHATNSIYSNSHYGNNKQNIIANNQQEIILTNGIIDNNSASYLNWISQEQQSELNGRALVGSLDRRSSLLFHQEQPIYLRTLLSDADLLQQQQNLISINGFNSIDRCNNTLSSSHHSRINQNQQQQQQQHQSKQRSRQGAKQTIIMNNNGNKQQSHYHGKHNQRVAFDLSPYELKNKTNSHQNQYQQQQQHIDEPINKATSDSSGSNSNQTADSGHESPPTNANSSAATTTTTMTANGCNHISNSAMSTNMRNDNPGLMFAAYASSQDYATNCSDRVISQEALELFAQTNGHNQIHLQHQQHQNQLGCNDVIAIGTASSLGSSIACSPAISEQLMSPSGQTSGLLMLVHEDPATSLSLHQNHQMATSFHANNSNNISSSSSISASKNSNYPMSGLPTINTATQSDQADSIYVIRQDHSAQHARCRNNQRTRHSVSNDPKSSGHDHANFNDLVETQDMENWL